MESKYYELVLEGRYELIKGFVLGYLEGKGIEGEAVFEQEHHIQSRGRLKQILRLLAVEDQARILIGENLGRLLRDVLEKTGRRLDIRIVSFREISTAWFTFRYQAFSRQFGDELKGLFANLPENVKLTDYELKENIRREAKGIEAYAPEHEYEIKASGKIAGPAGPVIDFYDRAEHYPLIELDEIILQF
ncbi:MAG: hypothetical protein ACE14T_08480 [Syntrophales bacterium]